MSSIAGCMPFVFYFSEYPWVDPYPCAPYPQVAGEPWEMTHAALGMALAAALTCGSGCGSIRGSTHASL